MRGPPGPWHPALQRFLLPGEADGRGFGRIQRLAEAREPLPDARTHSGTCPVGLSCLGALPAHVLQEWEEPGPSGSQVNCDYRDVPVRGFCSEDSLKGIRTPLPATPVWWPRGMVAGCSLGGPVTSLTEEVTQPPVPRQPGLHSAGSTGCLELGGSGRAQGPATAISL